MTSFDETHYGIVAQLRMRNSEIEEAIVARIRSVEPEAPKNKDVQYDEGQRATVVSLLDYALAGIESGREYSGSIPAEVVAQTQRAARRGIQLGTIIRRYYAASAELADFMTWETVGDWPDYQGALRRMQRTQALLLDHLIVAVNEAYLCEVERLERSPEQRRAERVQRLLAGDSVDSTDLNYDLGAWHLGMIGTGLGVGQTIRGLAAGLDCQLLCVSHDDDIVSAWLGGARKAVVDDLERLTLAGWPASVSMTIGEPRKGIDGWRWTHQEAKAALLVAQRKPQRITRCADIVLEAAMCGDELLSRTLTDIYLSPLDRLRIGGLVARQTLRAYFAAGSSITEAASRLKVDRRTVWYRLDKIATGLGWSPEERRPELEVALRIEALDDDVRENRRAECR